MAFFEIGTAGLSKLIISATTKMLTKGIEDRLTHRRMSRLVDDAVDRVVQQAEAYLDSEKVAENAKELLINAICARLEPFAESPQEAFRSDLDPDRIFQHAHPNGELPQEIREEGLEQVYSVLFREIAQLVVSSPVALKTWQAEGYREGFQRLTLLAEAICAVNAKVVDVPRAIVKAFDSEEQQEADSLLRELRQALLSRVLLKIDLSPLRAERPLQGALSDHFVVPAIRERIQDGAERGTSDEILDVLAAAGARSVLHGVAGVGKTTIATWLQASVLQSSQERLAVVLRLRTVKQLETRTVLDILQEQAGVHHRDRLTNDVLRRWYADGKVLLILDGFDEVPEGRRDDIQSWLISLSVVTKRAALLVTTRPLQSGHWDEKLIEKSWRTWDLLPFDAPRIVEFITRWHQHLPAGELSVDERKVDAEGLAATFSNDPSLAPLSNTPLMLGTLLFVHHRDKRLPSGRCDLYQRYISAMLGLRDSGLGIEARSTRLSDLEKRRVLGQIALHLHLRGVNEVGDDTMREIVRDALERYRLDEDVERLLAALSERSGLLQGPGAWSLVHKTIGEFLVAEIVQDGTLMWEGQRLDRQTLWDNRDSDAWTAALFFWAGLTSPRELEEFIDRLLDVGSTSASNLALSLLQDQGDRLPYQVQRRLALELLTRGMLDGHGMIAHIAPSLLVPTVVNPTHHATHVPLRGMTSINATSALEALIERGVLNASDSSVATLPMRQQLTVAALWVASHENYLVAVEGVSARDMSIYRFSTGLTDINAWAEKHPEGLALIPLLIMGRCCEGGLRAHEKASARDERIHWGRALWSWRNQSVADDWLVGSEHCAEANRSMAPAGMDLISGTRRALRSRAAAEWGLTDEQHSELLGLCDRLEARRAELIALRLDEPGQAEPS